MTPGRIEEYKAAFDLNKDGNLTSEEIQQSKEIMELELKEEKAEAHKRMTWVSLIAMIVFTGFLFSPVISVAKVDALGEIFGLFYLAQASVIGFYFGATAYMTRR
jgi:hypothetical protein|tara:strand:- start:88 stop:402 length:315 start_codon:yes stop_codon:yes gene_type:complete